MAAPTAVNRQPWAFVVITDRATLATLADGLGRGKRMLHKAPAAIVVCGDLQKALPAVKEYWVQDCSAATQNILLAAEALGLGAVWCGIHPNPAPVAFARKVLGLPEHIIRSHHPGRLPRRQLQIQVKWKLENMSLAKMVKKQQALVLQTLVTVIGYGKRFRGHADAVGFGCSAVCCCGCAGRF
jgi:nitroreductase